MGSQSSTDTSAPKQTETTQRWKVGLSRAGDELPVRTKVEFSRRDDIEETKYEAVDREVLRPYGLTPVLAAHYTTATAIRQKLHALAVRTEPQPRDVFELSLLFARPDAATSCWMRRPKSGSMRPSTMRWGYHSTSTPQKSSLTSNRATRSSTATARLGTRCRMTWLPGSRCSHERELGLRHLAQARRPSDRHGGRGLGSQAQHGGGKPDPHAACARGTHSLCAPRTWWLEDALDPMRLPEYLTAPLPAYVSLQTALHRHGLIEQIPEVAYAVSLAKTQRVKTTVGTFSIHHVAPEVFGGWKETERGAKIATAEKALFDFAYLSSGRSRLFTSLPELELPRGFRRKELWQWLAKIPSERSRTLTSQKLEELLAKAGA